MSVPAETLLSQTQDAISALLTALANVNVQEYWMADGRKIVRADFARTLKELEGLEQVLQRRVARESGSRPRFKLVRFGKPI